jgi:hypothetical protein
MLAQRLDYFTTEFADTWHTDRHIFLSSLVVAQRAVATIPGCWSLVAMTVLPFWLISFANGR